MLINFKKVTKGSSEYIDLEIVGMQAIMKFAVYESGGAKTFNKMADPVSIINEIVSYVNTTRGRTVFNPLSGSYGTNVNIDFDDVDCLSALTKVVQNTANFIDFLPNGNVVFDTVDESVADHKLTFGTHASEMIREFDGISMSNDLTVDYVG